MSLSVFFSPVSVNQFSAKDGFYKSQFGDSIVAFEESFPELEGDEKPQLVIFGVEEERGAVNNAGTAQAPDEVRKHLYQLYQGDYKIKIADLGNIKAGNTIRDTYFAVKSVVEELVKMDIVPIIIGGGHDLTYAQYMAYENLEQRVEVAIIDPRFDLDQEQVEHTPLNSQTFLNHIILHQPDYLFNLNNIAYQTYLVSKESVNMYDKLFFNATRVGAIAGKMDQSEPLIRAADMVSFDIGAIRSSEACGNANTNPNGLFGDEACQLARYAGMSDKCSSVGFYEFNPKYDPREQTAMLVSQMIWCFVDGYYNRKQDAPLVPKASYIIYRTTLESMDHELVFVKSKKSDRWWIQVPYFGSKSVNERYYLVPCRYEDYQLAVSGEMPDLWWRTHQKLQ
ncbi:arginase family protein [Sphingobacterium spiritivorum ATCC 33300]|uniref:Arginase family protein n=1 Tax=Sphingobacterium spiritivorum ATCC 33300 TaxID=525372 RepID=C2G0E3_SPHSI|nr:formimidoylglutamase [Sphingobacterium spiritivorum]EEI91323.1 arginase family protein [Sphingobacterium spiritivorum ATCC 33300]QQS97426.1 formimidoylglutamase [Sphingobacterium spiritivorum]